MAIRHIFIVLLAIHCLVAEEDDHDHDHDHDDHGDEEHESLKKKCEETAGKKYCFQPDKTQAENCFSTTDADSAKKYCECTEGGLDTTVKNTEIKWDATKKVCSSKQRTECDKYKTELYSYYRGKCFSEQECLDADKDVNIKDKITWYLSNKVATCMYLEDRCAQIDETEYEKDKKECHCEKKGAEFHNDHCHADKEKVDNAKKWGYGIIATAIISLFAVFGVFLVLMRHQWWYSYLLSTMVALAMGCLLSDATLHLIPLALGLHHHEEEEGHEGHGHEEEEMSQTEIRNICIGITVGVYVFLLAEKAIQMIMPHAHSHGGNAEVHANPAADTEMKDINGVHKEDLAGTKGICSVNSVAWMVIIGDALHNFADGLVMGAAFTNSLGTGLGTSIAILCHEIPHELGDFAVLLNAGMKIKFAVLFNFLSALTCFLGLFVGFAIGENENAQKWIFAFTGGMFIYIACADLIPEMHAHTKKSKKPFATLALQQVGMIVGFLVIWLLAVYEGDLEKIGGDGHHDDH